MRLERLPHTPLTPAIHLWDVDFKGVLASSGPSLQGITPAAAAEAQSHTSPQAAAGAGAGAAEAGPAVVTPTAGKGQSESTGQCEVTGSRGATAIKAAGSSAAVVARASAQADGLLNSAAIWFTLHLDGCASISTAPCSALGIDGRAHRQGQEAHKDPEQQRQQAAPGLPDGLHTYWGQGLITLDFMLPVQRGEVRCAESEMHVFVDLQDVHRRSTSVFSMPQLVLCSRMNGTPELHTVGYS